MEKGYLLKKPNGDVWQWDLWQAGMGIVDFTNPEAYRWFQDKLRVLLDQGIDCFKTDFGERIPTDIVFHDGSDPLRMHNYYTYLYNKCVFELLEEYKGKLDTARETFRKTDALRSETRQETMDIARAMDTLRGELDSLTERARKSELQLQKVEGELEQLQNRIWEDYELTYALAREICDPAFKLAEGERRAAEIKARIKALGTVNVAAVDEYRQTAERFEQLSAQRDDLVKAQLDLQDVIASLVKEMEATFRSQFQLMDAYFRETFKQLFGGGHAELRLTDPKDVLNCGIDVVAQPPGKKLQMLSLLSGGERALTAIAILFAVLKLKPTPFCFLDEIEAALDDANIDRYAEYLADYAKSTQFVVITHRKGTMERCDALFGVAMEEKGVSKLVSVKLKDAI